MRWQRAARSFKSPSATTGTPRFHNGSRLHFSLSLPFLPSDLKPPGDLIDDRRELFVGLEFVSKRRLAWVTPERSRPKWAPISFF